LTTNKIPPFDLGQLRSQGIEPTALSIIGVKAGVGQRRAYDPIAAELHRAHAGDQYQRPSHLAFSPRSPADIPARHQPNAVV
jgi:microcystin degradation protein MlrC